MKSLGGTELLLDELLEEIDLKLLDRVDIQFAYPTASDKPIILWQHHSYDQGCVQFMRGLKKGDYGIEHIVFVSHWQAEQYKRVMQFTCPYSVIPNSIRAKPPTTGFFYRQKLDTINLFYASAPYRGLDILVDALHHKNFPSNCNVYAAGGMGLYGEETDPDGELYERLNQHPRGNSLGILSNDQVRKRMDEFHILAYPCTFEETSCRTVIEALYHDMKVVTSSIGALPETTKGMAYIYSLPDKKQDHVDLFVATIQEAVDDIKRGNDFSEHERSAWSGHILSSHNIERTVKMWADLIDSIDSIWVECRFRKTA